MKKSTGIILVFIAGIATIILCLSFFISPSNKQKQFGNTLDKPTVMTSGSLSAPSASPALSGQEEKTVEVGGVEYKTGQDLAWPTEQLGGIERPASGKLTAVTTSEDKNTISLTIERVDGSEMSDYTDRMADKFPVHTVTDNSGHGFTFKGSDNKLSVEFLYDITSTTAIIKVTKNEE